MFSSTRNTALLCGWSLLLPVLTGAQTENTLSDETFRTALDAFNANAGQAETIYGPIEEWDVSQVTDFSRLGFNPEFQRDLSGWNVSSATTMEEVRI